MDSQTSRKRRGKGKGKGSSQTLFAETANPPSEVEVDTPAVPPTLESPGEGPNGDGENLTDENPPPEEVDVWWADYYANCPTYVMHVSAPAQIYRNATQEINDREINEQSPLMLIDSGSSLSVAGKKWMTWRDPDHSLHDSKNGTTFRFGAVPNLGSLGRYIPEISLPPVQTNKKVDAVLKLRIHAVDSNVPMLISRQSLTHVNESLNFSTSILSMNGDLEAQLKQTPSGHLAFPGLRGSKKSLSLESPIVHQSVYDASLGEPMEELSITQLKKEHRQLGHCSEDTLWDILRAAHITIPREIINRLHRECRCQAGVQRVAPPPVSAWIAKSNGELVAVDVCYPFMDAHKEIHDGNGMP